MKREDRLFALYGRIYSHPKLVMALLIIGRVLTGFVILSFLYAVSVLVFFEEFISVIKLVALTGIPFFIVSFMRSGINRQRPYEIFKTDEMTRFVKGRKSGNSFPSRHVFSAFLIGTLWMMYAPIIGITVLFIGLYLAIERVLLGIHFVSDVIAGAIIGLASGAFGILIW